MKKGMKLCLMMIMLAFLTIIGSANVKAGDVTLKNGKWAKGTLTSEYTEQYYKINIKKTGYIKIEHTRDDKESGAGFSVCNSKKKVLYEVESSWASNKETGYIAVKKGTYYIRIYDIANNGIEDEEEYDENETESYKIRYTFTKMKEGHKATKPGKGLNKAPVLKKNKAVSGVFFANKADRCVYYKLVVPKKQKVKFYYEVEGMGNELLEPWLRIADKKGQFLYVDDKGNVEKNSDNYTAWIKSGNDYVNLDKGTYYFVIQIHEGLSGYYKLKIK